MAPDGARWRLMAISTCALLMADSHRRQGTWGIDCGFGTPDAAAADAAELEQRRRGLSGPFGWTQAMVRAAPPEISAPPSRQLRIFVYHLPPRFNIWLAAHFRRSGRWDQSYLYSLDAKLHRWLLRSPYRTLDPSKADYFLVPAYLSLGFYDFEFGWPQRWIGLWWCPGVCPGCCDDRPMTPEEP